MAGGQVRVWRPDWPCPVVSVLHQQRHGGGDPTFRVDERGRVWRGIRTPRGAGHAGRSTRWTATARCTPRPGATGAEWALESVPGLLGADDDWTGFEPRHPVLEESWRRHQHARLGRSGLVMESLVPAIIEQKVTGQEAFAGFRRLVHRYGERAPGPGVERKVWVQPSADDAAADPVLGVAQDAHRPGPVPDDRHGEPGRRQPRAHDRAQPRGGRPPAPHHPRRRGVDERGGAAARPRRPRRGLVRRLPRRQGRRLGADRHAVRRRRARGVPGAVAAAARPGPGAGRRWPGCAGPGTARGWRRARICRCSR